MIRNALVITIFQRPHRAHNAQVISFNLWVERVQPTFKSGAQDIGDFIVSALAMSVSVYVCVEIYVYEQYSDFQLIFHESISIKPTTSMYAYIIHIALCTQHDKWHFIICLKLIASFTGFSIMQYTCIYIIFIQLQSTRTNDTFKSNFEFSATFAVVVFCLFIYKYWVCVIHFILFCCSPPLKCFELIHQAFSQNYENKKTFMKNENVCVFVGMVVDIYVCV